MSKVVKFGGSSLASAEQFKKVGDIIRADEDRKFVVPSAPGKRFSKDTKVTEDFEKIKARYNEIIEGLGLSLDLCEKFEEIKKNFAAGLGKDYAASRGEHLNGIILADYLGYEFVDPADAVFFDENGEFDAEKTNKVLKTLIKVLISLQILLKD